MESELKPCGCVICRNGLTVALCKCGFDPASRHEQAIWHTGGLNPDYLVHCARCNEIGPERATPEFAIAAWNTRQPEVAGEPVWAELRAEVERLKADLREQAMQYLAADGQAADLIDQVSTLRAKGDALARYVRHSDKCDYVRHLRMKPCTCGLDEALSQWKDQNNG